MNEVMKILKRSKLVLYNVLMVKLFDLLYVVTK